MYAKAGVYYCYNDPCFQNNTDDHDDKEREKLSKFQSFLLEEKGTIF